MMLVKNGVLGAIQCAFRNYYKTINIFFDIQIPTPKDDKAVNANVNWTSGDADVKNAYSFYCNLGKAIWVVSDINSRCIHESQTDTLNGDALNRDEYHALVRLFYDTLTKSDGMDIIPPLDMWKYGWIEF